MIIITIIVNGIYNIIYYCILLLLRNAFRTKSAVFQHPENFAGRLNDRNMKGYDVDVDYYIYTSLNYLCALMDIRFDMHREFIYVHPFFILRIIKYVKKT